MSQSAAQTAPEAPEDDYQQSKLGYYLSEAWDLYGVIVRTLYYLFRGKREKGAVAQQCYDIGNKSLFFMTVTMGFIGAIIVYQMGVQAQKIIPDQSLLGATYIKLLLRDLAPSVGAMPLATRVGAGIAAEIGSMVVTEQTDALRMSAAEPVDYLVVPRFVACTVMGTSILIWGTFVAYMVGMVVAMASFDLNAATYLNFSQVTPGDWILGLIKCVAYGATIALVSSQRGLRTFGGSEGVGTATTEAVVGSLFAIIVLNLFLSGFGYFLLPA